MCKRQSQKRGRDLREDAYGQWDGLLGGPGYELIDLLGERYARRKVTDYRSDPAIAEGIEIVNAVAHAHEQEFQGSPRG